MNHKALLFDLDGVLTDTARYHFLAWKQLADELDISFDQKINEKLKGVSRMRSLEIILETGGISMSRKDKEACCEKKNSVYTDYIRHMTRDDTLPGVREFLAQCKKEGYLLALGSASKNSNMILNRLDIASYFDAIVDGNMVSHAKPDPEVYLTGAKMLNTGCSDCIVFEDAKAGIEAAHAAGMVAVGIGTSPALTDADLILKGFSGISISDVEAGLNAK